MDTKKEMLAEAIGSAGSGYIEEALETRRISIQ